MKSRLINRNITTAAGRSGMRLEPEIWSALKEICDREHVRLADLIAHVEAEAGEGGRTSAVRSFAFRYFRWVAAGSDRIQGLAKVVVPQPRPLRGRPPRSDRPEPPRRMMAWAPGVRP